MIHTIVRTVGCLLFSLLLSHLAQAQTVTPTFTYQGELQTASGPANASFDMQFRLFSAASGGSQIGSTITRNAVQVQDGLFAVSLDFGSEALAGDRRWLEVRIRPAGSGSYETLTPRTEVTAAPYAWGARVALPNSVSAASIVDGAVGSSQINAAQVQRRVSGDCPPGQSIRRVDEDGTVFCQTIWSRFGNFGTNPAIDFIGTTDNRAFVIRTHLAPSLRIEPSNILFDLLPATVNMIAGSYANEVLPGVRGATIAGGGVPLFTADPEITDGGRNVVSSHYSVVSGGINNRAGNDDGNPATGALATVGGGLRNGATGNGSTVGGGIRNRATGDGSTVGGGDENTASGTASTVSGGWRNCAGGNYSWAGGRLAKVRPATNPEFGACSSLGSYPGGSVGDQGTFIWADSQSANFVSTGSNQFLIRAQGGFALNTNTPRAELTVETASKWNPTIGNGFGDFHLGDATRGLAMGVSTGGGGAGTVRLWNTGGNRQISFVNAGNDVVLTVNANTGIRRVGVARNPAANALEVEGNASKTTAGQWLANSDARIKTDVAEIGDAVSTLLRLRPVTFRYTEAYRAAHPSVGETRHFNVLAQEFAEVFPDAVQRSGEFLPGHAHCAERPDAAGCAAAEILQVDVHPALMTSIAAVQELAVALEQADSAIAEVRAENAALRHELAELRILVQALLKGAR